MDLRSIVFVILSLVCFGVSDFLMKIVSTNLSSVSELLRDTKILFPAIGLAVTGILGFAFWFLALRYGDVSKLAPIQKMSLIITVPLGIMILHEAFTWKTIAATVLAMLAIILIVI